MKKALPIGLQDFWEIRNRGCSYVDKTAVIHEIIAGSGKSFFLSRPRRFGKTLLCSTLEAIFEGRRELFQETTERPALAIDSLDWDWRKHPVIRLDVSLGTHTQGVEHLESALHNSLEKVARKNRLDLRGRFLADQFANLITDLRELYGERVAVIIDEYDKPLLDTILDPPLHESIRDLLRGFYRVVKSVDPDLCFVLLTGITKFSHVSLFSDLNHLTDISLHPSFATICGFTQEELEREFAPAIDGIVEKTNTTRSEYLRDLRVFYNGFRFSKAPITVFSPYGMLVHFFDQGEFEPYWYTSSSPGFLIRLVAEQKIDVVHLSNTRITKEGFQKWDALNMDALSILCQSGYLTISDYDAVSKEFILDFPNIEVRSAFSKSIVEQYLSVSSSDANALIRTLPAAFNSGDIEGAITAIRAFLASIPYDIAHPTEIYYQTAIVLMFRMLGLGCRAEVRTATGRIDTLIETLHHVYCFEFKRGRSAKAALDQINSKDYLLPWTGSGKKLFKVGVAFDTRKRNIADWKFEVVPPS